MGSSSRDATARSIRPVFTLDQPRSQQDWPEVLAHPVEPMTEALLPLDAPLNGLGKALFGGVLALGKGMGATVPDLPPDAVITGAQAIAIGQEVLGDLFPAMRA
jgi:phospholipase C